MEPNEQLQQAMILRWDQRKQEKAQSILGHPPKDQDKTINARFQEIDSIIKDQQNLWELWVRKRRFSLLTIFDRQFYRIDDLDQKMAAVQLNLENNNLLMASNQQRNNSKINLQEMLMDTAEQELDEV